MNFLIRKQCTEEANLQIEDIGALQVQTKRFHYMAVA